MQSGSSPLGSFMQRGFEIYIARLHPEIEQTARMLFGICKVAPQASFRASNADFERSCLASPLMLPTHQ